MRAGPRPRMANVVRDPKVHPDAIIPDLAQAPTRLVKFTKEDVAFVYGSKWKQRYLQEVRRHLCAAAGAMGHLDTKKWLEYHVADNQRLVGGALSRPRRRQFRPPHRRRSAMAAIR